MTLWGQLKCLICINESCKSKYEAKTEKKKILKIEQNSLTLNKIDMYRVYIYVYICTHIYICIHMYVQT